jgi:hypothetical protein
VRKDEEFGSPSDVPPMPRAEMLLAGNCIEESWGVAEEAFVSTEPSVARRNIPATSVVELNELESCNC